MVVALLFYYLKSHQLSQVINDYFFLLKQRACVFSIFLQALISTLKLSASKTLVFSTAIVIVARKILVL